jgi:hypothetical protein
MFPQNSGTLTEHFEGKEDGMSYSEDTIQAVWEKGTPVSGNDPKLWRKDQCGAWIARKHYANRDSSFGWEIDHITPQSEGGGDELSNLRPLQWQNNVATAESRLTCVVTASGAANVRK